MVAGTEIPAGLVEDPVLRYHYRFRREGDVLHVEMWVEPDGGVTVEHFHPSIEERFDVIEGEATFTADGEKKVAGAGERVVVPPGVRHTFQNTGKRVARINCEAEPAMELQGFLEETAELGRAGKFTRRGFPTGPGALLEAVEQLDRFKDTVVITGGALPPLAIQRIVVPPLARFQRRRAARKVAAS